MHAHVVMSSVRMSDSEWQLGWLEGRQKQWSCYRLFKYVQKEVGFTLLTEVNFPQSLGKQIETHVTTLHGKLAMAS